MLRKLPLYLALLLLTQCSKCKNDPLPIDPVNQLPPATQTGANTFGCLVNGMLYTPSGYNGVSNYAVLYDPGFQGGSLQVQTYRYPKQGVSKTQEVALGGIHINHIGDYQIGLTEDVGASFIDDYRNTPCNEYRSDRNNTYAKGTLTITKLDLNAGIISGTFGFTLAQPGCDTIKVTQGRFDKKL
ncbi:DUF6252 family protein [Hymenobacter persicinus]|uniref:Uncharacterized protein n=1 Tax=Hymenobacter persicinus TaxID=2025506 RepID=A0A4Q5LDL4_9BACT|nr:DUF6252 family protein [Hymenobacter persicinus]RYU81813.1 hypothetical protein EWM57_05385 [Hymenobacter persicinus]